MFLLSFHSYLCSRTMYSTCVEQQQQLFRKALKSWVFLNFQMAEEHFRKVPLLETFSNCCILRGSERHCHKSCNIISKGNAASSVVMPGTSTSASRLVAYTKKKIHQRRRNRFLSKFVSEPKARGDEETPISKMCVKQLRWLKGAELKSIRTPPDGNRPPFSFQAWLRSHNVSCSTSGGRHLQLFRECNACRLSLLTLQIQHGPLAAHPRRNRRQPSVCL